jgi:hypothetical protein
MKKLTTQEWKEQIGTEGPYLVYFPSTKKFARKSYGRNNGLVCGQTAHVQYAHKYESFDEVWETWGHKMVWDRENPGYDLPRIVTVETAKTLEK